MHTLVRLIESMTMLLVDVAVIFTVAHGLLLTATLGNTRLIKFGFFARNVVTNKVPKGGLFICDRDGESGNETVSVVLYDSARDEEVSYPLWHLGGWFASFSLLVWSGRSYTLRGIKRRIRVEITCRLCLFFLAVLPLVIAGLWLTAFVHWVWSLALLYLVIHQAFFARYAQFFFMFPIRLILPMLSAIFFSYVSPWHYFHLDALRNYSVSYSDMGALAILCGLFGIAGMIVLGWDFVSDDFSRRSKRKSLPSSP